MKNTEKMIAHTYPTSINKKRHISDHIRTGTGTGEKNKTQAKRQYPGSKQKSTDRKPQRKEICIIQSDNT